MIEGLVTVIMPAFNAKKFICESIQSVINQTYTNWEFLIVDDGSTDNTKDKIVNFCEKDSRIKYYWQSNSKPGKARNLALTKANGVYTAFLDADDIWLPEKLDIQLKELKKENVDLVFSDAYIFTDDASTTTKYMHSGKGFFNGENGLKQFLELNKIPILTVLTKTEILRKANGFTESPLIPQAEDYHLWLKLLLSGYKFFGSELILAGYREHALSFSNTDKLSVPKVIEALHDLKTNNKPFAAIITNYLKKWFVQYHYSTNAWKRDQYDSLISKNCRYLNKKGFIFFFKMLYNITGLNFTRKLITRVLNNFMIY